MNQDFLNAQSVQLFIEENASLRSALELTSDAQVNVDFVARGEYNVNFAFDHPATGERLLFRINLGSQMHLDDQIGYEAAALDILRPSGRTPRVLYVDGSGAFHGCGVLVEQWLSGRPLDYGKDMDEAARILADIHAVKVPASCGLVRPDDPMRALVDECDTMFKVYRDWSYAEPSVIKRVGALRAQAVKSFTEKDASAARTENECLHIVNTELNSRNFLVNDGNPGYLVDWEKPIIGEVEQDLAHFLAPTTTFWKTDTVLDRARMDDFLDAYIHAVDERFDASCVHERVRLYMAATCLRGITWSAMAYAQHESNVRSVADAYTLGKVRAYLTTEFLNVVEDLCLV